MREFRSGTQRFSPGNEGAKWAFESEAESGMTGSRERKGRWTMQGNGQISTTQMGERKRVEAVVETLARIGSRGESLSELAHDARNMVTALGLYCELLEEPGVLTAGNGHYAQELKLVAAASRKLVEKMVALEAGQQHAAALPAVVRQSETAKAGEPEWSSDFGGGLAPGTGTSSRKARQAEQWQAEENQLIRNLAAELLANRNLLSALAGPRVAVLVEPCGGAQPVRMSSEDLTRILVNLVKNASEAMNGTGRIEITVRETTFEGRAALELAIEDSGAGIAEELGERVFESGYSTRSSKSDKSGWTAPHRGLGLAITRSLVDAAGGRIVAARRGQKGARFELTLPVYSTHA